MKQGRENMIRWDNYNDGKDWKNTEQYRKTAAIFADCIPVFLFPILEMNVSRNIFSYHDTNPEL